MIGWLGSLFLGFCGLPQALKAYRDGHVEGLDPGLLVLWTLGEIFTGYAVLGDAPLGYLILNYGLNLVFLSVLWRYWLSPRKS